MPESLLYQWVKRAKALERGLGISGSLVLFVVMIEICGVMPADPLWRNQGAYDVILGAVPRIAAASLTAYFVGEFSNSYVLAKCKIRTHGRFMFLRSLVLQMPEEQLVLRQPER